MDFKDYYATLGVPKTSPAKEIKQAYRKLARKFHPDVNPGDKAAEARFKEINEAQEVLSDPEKRKKYDELGANWRMYEQAQRSGGTGAGSPFGEGGHRTMTAEEMHELFGDENPFSDFFQTFFGGGGPDVGRRTSRGGARSTGRGRRGRDAEQEVDLSLEDASRGTTLRLQMKLGGQARAVDVRIPPGVGDGSRVRVAGEGEPGSGGAPSGDLFLRIRLLPDVRFERKGQDLYVKVRVPVTTAVLGGEADVPNLGDRPLRLKIPPLTQNGQVFRLKGHGIPLVGKPGEHGDLYAGVEIELQRHLSSEEREHWEALAKLAAGKTHSATGVR